MLDMDNFNGNDFQDIVDMAKKQVSYLDSDWTNMQEYDPGITFIELFAWLKVIQVEYMKFISKDSLYKFLDLLDTSIKHNKGSQTLIRLDNLENNVLIPKGTKWLTDDDMVFENEHVHFASEAKVKGISFENPDFKENISSEKLDNKRFYYAFGERLNKNRKEKRSFTIHFDKALKNCSLINLYFNVHSKWEDIRNPIGPNDNFIEMADILWEYYGVKNGVQGWHKIDVVKDRTHSFLFSNIISLKFFGDMIPVENNFDIRVTLLSQNYDYPPVLRDVSINVFNLTQKDTRCESTIIKKRQLLENQYVKVLSNLALYGEHVFYVNKNGSWLEIDGCNFERHVEEGYVTFEFKNIEQYISKLNNQDPAVMIVSYFKEFPDKTTLASGTGVSSQTVELNCADILYENFDIMVGRKDATDVVYDKWDKVTSFFSSSKYSKHYVLDWEENVLRFGDNEMGIAPCKLNNNIRILNIAYTKGRGSNIKSHMIKKVLSRNEKLTLVKVTQIKQATGGRNNDTFRDIRRKPVDIFDKATRAVTINDYETIVRQTPGLIIENMKVLPNYLPNKSTSDSMNCVTIAIQQGEFNKKCNYLESYSKNIKAHLDKYRLINTRIEVTGPSYIGIKISGNITINSYESECRSEIENGINEFIKKLNRNLGRPLYFGELFGTIERMDCVIYLEDFHITPTGDYVKRTKSDDIIVQPNGAYYIEDIDFNYLRSTNF